MRRQIVRPIEDSGERCSGGLLDLVWIEAAFAETRGLHEMSGDALEAMVRWEKRRRRFEVLRLGEDKVVRENS